MSTLPPIENKRDIEFIHSARALAVIIVLYVHLFGWWMAVAGEHMWHYDKYQEWIVRPFNLYQSGGHIGVVLFFLVSGYIISHVSIRETRSDFLIRRFFRIAPMLVVGIISMIFCYWISEKLAVLPPLGDGIWSKKDILANIFLVNYPKGSPSISTVTWTLFIEVIFYLIIFAAPKTANYHASTCIIIAISVFSQILKYTPVYGFLGIPQITGFTPFIAILAVGRCIYFCETRKNKYDIPLLSLSIIAFFSVYEMQWPGKLILTGGDGSLTTYVSSIFIFIALMKTSNNKTNPVVKYISSRSYSIYLLHIPIGTTALSILHKNTSLPLAYFAAIILIALFCELSYRTIELPTQTLGKFIAKKLASKNKGMSCAI